jgi:hypothetical protein
LEDAVALRGSGLFKSALERLVAPKSEARRLESLRFALSSGELNLQCGNPSSANALLNETQSPTLRVNAYKVVREVSASRREFPENVNYFDTARAFCRRGLSTSMLLA